MDLESLSPEYFEQVKMHLYKLGYQLYVSTQIMILKLLSKIGILRLAIRWNRQTDGLGGEYRISICKIDN